MNHVKVLDCTLRDGAYLVDKKFGDDVIRGIINGLMKAKVDIIEIGFFQDEGFGIGKTVYKNSDEAKVFIPADKQGCEFTVLADYSRYSVSNLDERREDSIDGVRECFFKSERYGAIEACKTIKKKGYKCFVQPVDILGYSDRELIEFLELVNEVEPYCLSIVDTFGSMYQDDLYRVFELINHNLLQTCKIGFHSHNNMQLSNALSQEFIRMTAGKREVVVDATISGMGRGAGNTPTELIIQYLLHSREYNYDMDALLDVIDTYMDNLRSRCSWGYNTPYFVAGSYGAHVNNISYLMKKNSIRSKDIRYILNKLGEQERKRYNYGLLEKTYMEYMLGDIDDEKSVKKLEDCFRDRNILVLLPGHSVNDDVLTIQDYIGKRNPIIISVNFIHEKIESDYVYLSNVKRYSELLQKERFRSVKKIIASNIKQKEEENECIVSFIKLVKCGWEQLDNSGVMLLRLLDRLPVKSIGIAGFDGYDYKSENKSNYADEKLERASAGDNPREVNEEILSMLTDFACTRNGKAEIQFVTKSRFEAAFMHQLNLF